MERRTIILAAVLGLLTATAVGFLTNGQALLGATIQSNLSAAGGVGGIASSVNFRETVVNILKTAISYLALIAVVAIVAAGITFMVSAGSDTAIQRARKIIIYTIVGLLVVFFARAIVVFLTDLPT